MASRAAPLKKIRKGAKSCIDCRQRKIRCIWDDGAPKCQRCDARGQACQAQVYSAAPLDPVRQTTRSRVTELEGTVSDMLNSLKRIETHFAIPRSDSPVDKPADIGDVESDTSDSEDDAVKPPLHLQHLFDNAMMLGPAEDEYGASPASSTSRHNRAVEQARVLLQDLLPPFSDVVVLLRYLHTWMAILEPIFGQLPSDGQDARQKYEVMCSSSADPTVLAGYLCPLAISIVLVPPETMENELKTIPDGSLFVKKVAATVEHYVFNNDRMMSTLPGIELGFAYCRLNLMLGRIKKMWLALRRLIAVAELMGLHRLPRPANFSRPPGTTPEPRQAGGLLWQILRRVDRLSNLMFNLPLATSGGEVDFADPIVVDGQIRLPTVFAYLTGLAELAAKIDDMHARHLPIGEVYQHVIYAGNKWHALYSMLPPTWWQSPYDTPESQLIWQYWYTGVRIYVQLAMRDFAGSNYLQVQATCCEICRRMLERYPGSRYAVPARFIGSKWMDIQAFTPAIFLLYVDSHPSLALADQLGFSAANNDLALIQAALATAEDFGEKPGGEYAKHVGQSLRSMLAFFSNQRASITTTVKIKVPLLGNVRVTPKQRQVQQPLEPHPNFSMMLAAQNQMTVPFLDVEMQTTEWLDWSMDISDDLAFMPNGFLDPDEMFFGYSSQF